VDHSSHTDRVLAMVGPFKAENLPASGGGMGHPEAQHGGLGSGGYKTNTFRARAQRLQTFGQLDGTPIDGGEVGAIGSGAGCGGDDLGTCMPRKRSTPSHGEVDELTSLGVPDARSGAPLDDRNEFGWQAEFPVGTCWECGQGALTPGGGGGGARAHAQGRLKVFT
jgi:hypothetical protein